MAIRFKKDGIHLLAIFLFIGWDVETVSTEADVKLTS